MENCVYQLVGYVLIWWAVSIGRKEDSKIDIFSLEWVAQILLVAIGVGMAHS